MKSIFSKYYLLLLVPLMQQAHAGELDLGLGLSFIEPTKGDAFEIGWDLQAGYEFLEYDSWNFGAQIQLTRGLIDEADVESEGDINYSSNALYFTARPKNWWVQFKGGVVQVDYQTLVKNESTTGYGLGMGVVLNSGDFRIHLIDYQRLTFGSDSFDVYTMSIGVMAN